MLQDARCFNDSQLDARKCQQARLRRRGEPRSPVSRPLPPPRRRLQVITKLLYLLNQGDSFSKNEATEVFFGVTKLFQSKDVNLRRAVYLMIKEVSCAADEVIIVTSSLMKDMNSKVDLFRANSIRVLCKIVDAGMLSQMERYLKQAVVDKSPVVASAALVSGIHLLAVNADVVRRWSNEVAEAAQSKHLSVQFHALALAHAIRAGDRLAASKMVSGLTKGGAAGRSPLATVLLVRFVAKTIADTGAPQDGAPRPFFDFLESCLRNKSEAAIFEAARAVADLKDVSPRELQPAVTVLQLFLSSSKPVLRFAAARTLNRIAMSHPAAAAAANVDMEALISDPNRSIATLAITTLLKTGAEASVERLMKQIQAFLTEIADENKIVVVEAVRALCLKYPSKHRALMTFLASILREEGGFEYKKAIVEAILTLIRDIPDAKESGLGYLCEFIEDCEFTFLSSQVLHVLGNEGPAAPEPAKYIRYIYNRVILENATVRAAAVSALAKFGAGCPALRPRVVVLLRRCLHDNDDEVRDRATLALAVLGGAPPPLPPPDASGAASAAPPAPQSPATLAAGGRAPQFADGAAGAAVAAAPSPRAPPLTHAVGLLSQGAGLTANLPALEAALRAYLGAPGAAAGAAFSIAGVPVDGSDAAAALAARAARDAPAPSGSRAKAAAAAAAAAEAAAAARSHADASGAAAAVLASIPAFARFGPLFKSSSPPIALTEEETEYKVVLTKHVFASHVVLQFACQNTIKEQVLSAVTVALTPQDDDSGAAFEEVATVPLDEMPLGRAASTFVAFARADASAAAAKFSAVLRFTVREVDPSTGLAEEEGFPDEYSLEDVDISPQDYVRRQAVGNFRKAWDDMGPESERGDDYGLGQRPGGLQEALEAVACTLGLAFCESSDVVPPNARSHTALLAGVYCGDVPVLARLQLGADARGDVAMKLTVRAAEPAVADVIHQIVSSS